MSSCADCPDLADSPDRPAGKLRPTCCRDDYLVLRREGHFESGSLGLEETRAEVDRIMAIGEKPAAPAPNPAGPRRERRAAAAKARRKA